MAGRESAAVLFLVGGMYTMDAYSTLNSSPWTAENSGADPAKMRSLHEYVCHAVVMSTIYCGAAAVIDESWWPVIGSVANNAYLVWLYRRAARRGAATGSTGFPNIGSSGSRGVGGLRWG